MIWSELQSFKICFFGDFGTVWPAVRIAPALFSGFFVVLPHPKDRDLLVVLGFFLEACKAIPLKRLHGLKRDWGGKLLIGRVDRDFDFPVGSRLESPSFVVFFFVNSIGKEDRFISNVANASEPFSGRRAHLGEKRVVNCFNPFNGLLGLKESPFSWETIRVARQVRFLLLGAHFG